jgi:predicted DNA-binding WGR domain protein
MNQRSLHYCDGKSDKFWTIILDGKSHTVHYGRVGTVGQTQTKEFSSEAEALKSYEKLVNQKLKKGYVEVNAESNLVQDTKADIEDTGRLERCCWSINQGSNPSPLKFAGRGEAFARRCRFVATDLNANASPQKRGVTPPRIRQQHHSIRQGLS